jgi:nucleoside phosphorylase
VGWVSALPIELAAAIEMLDQEHHKLPQNGHDTNLYTLGQIGEHNVVIACLPAGRIGNNPAAAVAMDMKSKFPSIRFGLMVGIGGGVPSVQADIRLGDVVVSQPHLRHGGVIQYDFGKSTPGGFERSGFLNTPPIILLSALSLLRANHDRDRPEFLTFLSALSRLPKFSRANAGPDILFDSMYSHVDGDTCDSCCRDRLVERTPRGRQEIVIHYGTIGSGNEVIKDGITRDRISSELGGVLCFEMEAAGLMNNFPCLVIRGICDYADSHKNKRWQPYAAATAAAYAKEILSVIPGSAVAGASTIDEAIKGNEGT